MLSIDINCDMGEGFGAYALGSDREIMPFISSANIACGFHASDPALMEETVRLAAENKAGIGAHPGFPDLVGFGRRDMAVSPAEAKALMLYQIGALDAFCRAAKVPLRHVKPHGALYNMAARDRALAEAVCEAVGAYGGSLILLALSGSEMVEAAIRKGLPVAREVFADRAYEEDGSLRARSKPDAMIEDEDQAVARVIRMVREGKVTAVTGRDVPIQADSVCIHGDGPHALAFARKIRSALEAAGIGVAPLSDTIG